MCHNGKNPDPCPVCVKQLGVQVNTSIKSLVKKTLKAKSQLHFTDTCKYFGIVVSQLLLWDPMHSRCSRGHPATAFVDQLEEDTGLFRQDLPAIMADKGEWDKLIKLVQVHPK